MAPPSSFTLALCLLLLAMTVEADGLPLTVGSAQANSGSTIKVTRTRRAARPIARSALAVPADVIGTWVTLYDQNNTQFARLRAPDASQKCSNLPALAPGQYIASAKIQWNVQDSTPNHAICSIVWFWTGSSCYGSGKGYCLGDCTTTQAFDVTRYDYTNRNISPFPSAYSNVHAIGCTVYSNNPCKNYTCQANSTCSLDSNLQPVCKCNTGYGMASGVCTLGCDQCTPLKANCAIAGGVPSCFCDAPNTMTAYGCQSPADLSHADYLDPHNAARKALGIPPLVWNTSVALQADSWAQNLSDTYSCKSLVHGMTDGVGQNLAAGSPIGAYNNSDPVKWWVNEQADYNYSTNSCTAGKMCGHYTQVVWRSTTSVGCASRECPGTNWKVWVCDYYPPGNYVGQKPY